jgi:hypothetical protein
VPSPTATPVAGGAATTELLTLTQTVPSLLVQDGATITTNVLQTITVDAVASDLAVETLYVTQSSVLVVEQTITVVRTINGVVTTAIVVVSGKSDLQR